MSKHGDVLAKAIPDPKFQDLDVIDQEEPYAILANSTAKAVPIKGKKLIVVRGLNNRISTPKPPYGYLQIIHEEQLS